MFRKLFENTITIIRAMEAAEDLEAALPSRVLELEAKLADLEARLASHASPAALSPAE